jgi:hypothetical protein
VEEAREFLDHCLFPPLLEWTEDGIPTQQKKEKKRNKSVYIGFEKKEDVRKK